MKLENMRPKRNIDNNDKLTDERYQKYLICDKECVVMDIPSVLHILIWLLGYLNILGKCYFLNFHRMNNKCMS